MKIINNKLRAYSLVILSGLFLLTSCNKDLEQFAPIPTPVYPSGSGVQATLAANPNYSNYAALIARAGMTTTLNDLTKSYTVFATDNTGMNIFANVASGGAIPIPAPVATVLAFINSFPVPNAAGIVQYNTIGQKFTAASLGSAFPNYPLTSQIILDPNQPFVRMNIFPVRGTPYSYVNNLPLIATDMAAANGLIHTSFTIAAPPTVTLKTLIATEATLSYFRAAVTRADSGAVGLSRFDSLMNYGVTNMTVLAPNDAAFQTLIFGLVYAQVFAATGSVAIATAQANAAVALGPAIFSTPAFYGAMPAATVKGIVAYHLLASLTTSTTTPYQPNIRVFSNNIPGTAGFFIKTLVNGSIAVHPGVMAQSTYVGPATTGIAFRGYGTFPPGGTPYSGPAATTVTMDKLAVNGVYHIINSVLLPQ
jgi:uncharacterized surface protein with fasciclin (FAS1) repeats